MKIDQPAKFLQSPILICTTAVIITFAVYLFALCPTVYLIDSGELAAVSYTLGIAHPTGYPLYTLISYFFAHLPGEPIRNLNMLSALFTVSAAIFLYLTGLKISKKIIVFLPVISLFAFAPTIWRTSITNEVYPLTILFSTLIIYSIYRLNNIKGFYITMYLIGLSFTNHIIIFSIALPVFFYIIFVYRIPLKKIFYGTLFVLLGLSLYLYIIARTSGGAELAWGNADNLQRLFWHITGKQYQVWMFSLPLDEIFKNIGKGLLIILRDFLYILIVPVFLGFYYLFTKQRQKFWFFISIFLLDFTYTINYSIPDIESYYIPGLIALIIVFTYGLKLLYPYLKWLIMVLVAVAIPIVNYHSCTLRNNYFAMDFSYAHLAQLPENSLLICTYWDIYSPAIYLRKVKNVRKDLIIIDKELLRRTWYIQYIENEYPEFYEKVKGEVDAYLLHLYKFEYDKPYDAQIIQMRYIKMLESFVDAEINTHVYFAVPNPDLDLNHVRPQHFRHPNGLVFEIKKDTTSDISFDISKLKIKKPRVINDERLKYNIRLLKNMIRNNYRYLRATNRLKNAEQVKDWLNDF
jgi:hypothetical protein